MWVLTYASGAKVDEAAIELFSLLNERPLLARDASLVRYLMFRSTSIAAEVKNSPLLFRPSCLPAVDLIEELSFVEAKAHAKTGELPIRLQISREVRRISPGSPARDPAARTWRRHASSLC